MRRLAIPLVAATALAGLIAPVGRADPISDWVDAGCPNDFMDIPTEDLPTAGSFRATLGVRFPAGSDEALVSIRVKRKGAAARQVKGITVKSCDQIGGLNLVKVPLAGASGRMILLARRKSTLVAPLLKGDDTRSAGPVVIARRGTNETARALQGAS